MQDPDLAVFRVKLIRHGSHQISGEPRIVNSGQYFHQSAPSSWKRGAGSNGVGYLA
jgi:hypothetical protein